MFDKLVYRDGSANAYRFHADGDGARFEYEPIAPERSSTGTYSGGKPRTGQLDAAQLAELWRYVSALEANTALRVTARGKGTGLFELTAASGVRSFIVMRRAELLAFDAYVAAL